MRLTGKRIILAIGVLSALVITAMAFIPTYTCACGDMEERSLLRYLIESTF